MPTTRPHNDEVDLEARMATKQRMSLNRRTTTAALAGLMLAGAGFGVLPASAAQPAPAAAAAAAAPVGEQTFFNPIKTGADPSIYQHNGEYIFVESVNDSGIALRRSETITGLGDATPKVVWDSPATGMLCCEIWAPEVLRVRGEWYIYFAADDGDNFNHRMYVIKALTQDPFGAWSEPVKITDPTDRWAIDATVMETPGGDLYYLWSGWEGTTNVDQRIYIAPMSDPMTLSGPRVELSRPDQPWETAGAPPGINEGPEVLQKDGKTYIVYSASGSWTPDYCLGMLTNTGGNLLDPASWDKSDGCVFSRRDTAAGPGHHTFTKSPDGTEDWLLYHANTVTGSGWGGRATRAQEFTWDANGPVFGTPTSTYEPIPVPSGENSPYYLDYEAENAFLNRARAVDVTVAGASNGKKVGYIDFDDSYLEWDLTVPTAGTYDILVRYGNDPTNAAGTSQFVYVNGRPSGSVQYPRTAWDNWTFKKVPVELQAGANKFRLVKGSGYTELDMIRVPIPQATEPVKPAADYTTATACLGGKAVVTVRFRNTGDAAAAVTLTSPYGTKSWASVAPKGLVANNFAAPGKVIAAGEVTVSTVVNGVTASDTVPVAARTCS